MANSAQVIPLHQSEPKAEPKPRPKVEVRGAPFDALVMHDLYKIRDLDEDLMRELILGYQEGSFLVGSVHVDDLRVGSMIWSFMRDGDETIFVCNALAADSNTETNLLTDLEEMMRTLANARGCHKMRFWTRRPGLVRRFEAMGYEPRVVMERAL